jgi:hypothetical protein
MKFRIYPASIWIVFYLTFVGGWLVHPAMLYYEIDGHFFESTQLLHATWGHLTDFTVINPFQGMFSLMMPEVPWAHLGMLPLLLKADETLRHILSYSVYWLEFALATFFLARTIGFSPLVSHVGTQLWLFAVFPPFSFYLGITGWASLIPIQVQTIAYGNVVLALFIRLGEGSARRNLTLSAALVLLTVVWFFIAPLRLLAVAPGFAFLFACALLLDFTPRRLAWKLGVGMAIIATYLALHVPNYYAALFGHSPRIWLTLPGSVESFATIGEPHGPFLPASWTKLDQFFCTNGLFCAARPTPYIFLYGGMLLAAVCLMFSWFRKLVAARAIVFLISAAGFYVLLVVIYYAYTLPAMTGTIIEKLPSPLYVYNPVFPLMCLAAAQFWAGFVPGLLVSVPSLRLGRRGGWVLARVVPAMALAALPAFTLYAGWTAFNLGGNLQAWWTGAPMARSIRNSAKETTITKYLRDAISISPGGRFRGTVASYVGARKSPIGTIFGAETDPYAPHSLEVRRYLIKEQESSHMFDDLWNLGIPTIEENGHFISPAYYQIMHDLLSEPPNYTIPAIQFTYRADIKILAGMGAHYVISDSELTDPGIRLVIKQEGQEHTLGLTELKKALDAEAASAAPRTDVFQLDNDWDRAAASDTADFVRMRLSAPGPVPNGDRLMLIAAANGRLATIRYMHENAIARPLEQANKLLEVVAPAAKFELVRYLVTAAGARLQDLDLPRDHGLPLYLYEILSPNLASYSPTKFKVIERAKDAIAAMRRDDFLMAEDVIVQQPLQGPLVPVSTSSMTLEKNAIVISATSPGRSVLLLPVQFSRCWEMTTLDGSPLKASLIRADLAQSILSFEQRVDVRLRFAFGFGNDGACRTQDIKDLRAMHILEDLDDPK